MISSHGDTNSRSTCWLLFPPSMELAWVPTGPQSSRTLKRPSRTGILCSALMMSPYVFFFLFFIILWNHWQPHSGALEHPAIAAVINYTFGLKELHPALRMPCEDWRLKLESLSVQMFAYALTMVSNQLCWSTSIPHWTWIQVKYILNQYKTGAIAKPVQEFSHSEYANDWQKLYNVFNQWSKKVDCIADWQRISKDSGTRAV